MKPKAQNFGAPRRAVLMMGCCAVLAATTARAQILSNDDPLSPVMITAQRRAAAQTDTAAAIGVSTKERLADTQTRTFEDLSRLDPSLQLSAYQGEMQLFVRGVGAVTFIGGFDSSVAVYANGVYLSRPSAASPAFFDLERVEVLKGPQGSLYGRNATGGAVSLISQAPSQDWTQEASFSLGNYRTIDAFGAIGGPVSDTLSFRLALGSNNHEGFTRVIRPDPSSPGGLRSDRTESRHDLTTRLSLAWRPAERVQLDLIGDYYRADDQAVAFHFAGPGYDNNPYFRAWLAQGKTGPTGRHEFHSSIKPFNRPEVWGVTGKGAFMFDRGVLTSTTAVRVTRPENYDDQSNSTVLGESQFKAENARQFTQDLQFASNDDRPIRYLVGASYFRERNDIRNEYQFPSQAAVFGLPQSDTCCLLRANGASRTNAWAVFGEVSVDFSEKLTATLGGRYSSERRGGSNLLDFKDITTLNKARFEPARFNAFTPRAVLEYRPAPDRLFYGSITRGFKAGGFNTGSAQNTPFDPEHIWSYEVGAKLGGQRARVELSAFHYDYSDLQVQNVIDQSVMIQNAASARVDGVEIALLAAPTPHWHVDAAVTWLDARFSRYDTINTKTPALGVLDLSGHRLPQSTRLKARLGVERAVSLGQLGALRVRADALRQGRIWFSAFEDPYATQAGYWWLKAQATFQPTGRPYEIAVFIDNIANRQVFSNISITGDLDGSRAMGNLAPPRTFGVKFSYTR